MLIRRALEIARRENFVAHRGVYVGRDGPEPRNPRGIPLPPHDRRRRGRHVHRARSDRGGPRRHARLGLSIVTDVCFPDALKPANIEEIIATANEAEPKLRKIVLGVLAQEAGGA